MMGGLGITDADAQAALLRLRPAGPGLSRLS